MVYISIQHTLSSGQQYFIICQAQKRTAHNIIIESKIKRNIVYFQMHLFNYFSVF